MDSETERQPELDARQTQRGRKQTDRETKKDSGRKREGCSVGLNSYTRLADGDDLSETTRLKLWVKKKQVVKTYTISVQ